MVDRTFKLAMLGDRSAQERLTERGLLLPCPFCANENVLFIEQEDIGIDNETFGFIFCPKCKFSSDTFLKLNALHKWNTRSPILSAEELERLEETK